MLDFEMLVEAVETALTYFLRTDDFDREVAELVAQRIAEHLDDSKNLETFIESTSTFVQVDMSEDDLADYTDEIISQLEIYRIV